jgi:hypothetical protein
LVELLRTQYLVLFIINSTILAAMYSGVPSHTEYDAIMDSGNVLVGDREDSLITEIIIRQLCSR